MPTARTFRKAQGGAIRRIRELNGWSLRDVAARTEGVSYSYWANIEAGRRNPNPAALLAIARTLAVDVDDVSYVLPEQVA